MKYLKYFESNNAQSQLSYFNSNEDKIKSSFMKPEIKKNWKKKLKEKYPLLNFTFYDNNDIIKAEATIK